MTLSIFSSKITISASFNPSVDGRAVNAREKFSVLGVDAGAVTAEHAVCAAAAKPVRKGSGAVLKLRVLCALRGDKSLDF